MNRTVLEALHLCRSFKPRNPGKLHISSTVFRLSLHMSLRCATPIITSSSSSSSSGAALVRTLASATESYAVRAPRLRAGREVLTRASRASRIQGTYSPRQWSAWARCPSVAVDGTRRGGSALGRGAFVRPKLRRRRRRRRRRRSVVVGRAVARAGASGAVNGAVRRARARAARSGACRRPDVAR